MSRRQPGLHTESFGVGPELVLVHGWAMHSGVWRDFAERLADRVRVTLIDLPGHGLSGNVADFCLDSVVAALADAAPPRAHWLGWSLGALLATGVAERFPGRVRSLTLLAGSPRFVAEPDWPGVEAGLLAQVAANLETDFFKTLKRFIGLQTFGQENARALARHIEACLDEFEPPEVAAVRGGLVVLQQADLRDALSRSAAPTLAVLGAHDRLVPKAVGTALRALVPSIEVHVLDTAAHLPFATHPGETVGLVLDFIHRHHVGRSEAR
ncbi:pimeloyl-ACP methyl ester esterase BioH [Methylomagnum sp.]